VKRSMVAATLSARQRAPRVGCEPEIRLSGLVSMFVRLSEQTGQLPILLQRVTPQLSTAVLHCSMALANVFEPLLIVVMGLVVMLIVLAVLLPIIQLNQSVK
jgi:general secretion pathway protein F